VVVIPLKAKKSGGLDLFKAAVRVEQGHDDCLLNDGFFSLPSSGR
jgi:hypothetical protein